MQDGIFLREKEGAVFDAPQEFKDHVELITKLTDLIEDESVRVQLLDAIELLVHGMNGPWHGSSVGWQWGEVPDTIEGLF